MTHFHAAEVQLRKTVEPPRPRSTVPIWDAERLSREDRNRAMTVLTTRSVLKAAALFATGQPTMSKMIAHCTRGGEPINKAIDWAASEIEEFMRM